MLAESTKRERLLVQTFQDWQDWHVDIVLSLCEQNKSEIDGHKTGDVDETSEQRRGQLEVEVLMLATENLEVSSISSRLRFACLQQRNDNALLKSALENMTAKRDALQLNLEALQHFHKRASLETDSLKSMLLEESLSQVIQQSAWKEEFMKHDRLRRQWELENNELRLMITRLSERLKESTDILRGNLEMHQGVVKSLSCPQTIRESLDSDFLL
jgi:hypothetical protein